MITTDYQIELRHIRYFLTVAEELHFRRAAERLYISQPGLSRQIQQLEDRLQIKLFIRHNRKVELTQAGIYFRQELSEYLSELDQIIDRTKMVQDGMTGHLKLGYVGSAIQEAIPKLLVEIRQLYPKIIFDLEPMSNQSQIESLLNKQIDFGFVRMERVPMDLVLRPFVEDTFSLVLPADHRITATTFSSLDQLKEERFILFDPTYSDSYYDTVMQLFDDAGFAPAVTHNTVDASTIYRLVENNFGISIVPTSLTHGFDMKVKFIELDQISQRTVLNIVWHGQSHNPIVRRVLDLIR